MPPCNDCRPAFCVHSHSSVADSLAELNLLPQGGVPPCDFMKAAWVEKSRSKAQTGLTPAAIPHFETISLYSMLLNRLPLL